VVRLALERGGNRHYTIRFFAGADPDLRRSADGVHRLDGFPDSYLELVTAWVSSLAGQLPEASTQPAPQQARWSVPLRPLAWYESVGVQAAVLALLVSGFTGYLLAGLIGWLRGSRERRPGWAARVLAVAGLATALGLTVYGLGVMVTLRPGPVLAGRPLPWLALQALAFTAAGAAGVLVVRLLATRRRRDRRPSLRLVLLLAVSALLLPWAAYWGLLSP
jgi:hypothetical protein